MRNATKPHILLVDSNLRPGGWNRVYDRFRGLHSPTKAFGDYRRMKPVKFVPDDYTTVYIYLAVGIAIGFIVGVLI